MIKPYRKHTQFNKNNKFIWNSRFFAVLTMKNTFFWDVTPCSLLCIYQCEENLPPLSTGFNIEGISYTEIISKLNKIYFDKKKKKQIVRAWTCFSWLIWCAVVAFVDRSLSLPVSHKENILTSRATTADTGRAALHRIIIEQEMTSSM